MSYSPLLDWKVINIPDINGLAEVMAPRGWTALSPFLIHRELSTPLVQQVGALNNVGKRHLSIHRVPPSHRRSTAKFAAGQIFFFSAPIFLNLKVHLRDLFYKMIVPVFTALIAATFISSFRWE